MALSDQELHEHKELLFADHEITFQYTNEPNGPMIGDPRTYRKWNFRLFPFFHFYKGRSFTVALIDHDDIEAFTRIEPNNQEKKYNNEISDKLRVFINYGHKFYHFEKDDLGDDLIRDIVNEEDWRKFEPVYDKVINLCKSAGANMEAEIDVLRQMLFEHERIARAVGSNLPHWWYWDIKKLAVSESVLEKAHAKRIEDIDRSLEYNYHIYRSIKPELEKQKEETTLIFYEQLKGIVNERFNRKPRSIDNERIENANGVLLRLKDRYESVKSKQKQKEVNEERPFIEMLDKGLLERMTNKMETCFLSTDDETRFKSLLSGEFLEAPVAMTNCQKNAIGDLFFRLQESDLLAFHNLGSINKKAEFIANNFQIDGEYLKKSSLIQILSDNKAHRLKNRDNRLCDGLF